ncbi:tetratricopeptide repeat protein [Acanthopleuribacter pedis]|uniref:Sel1 repeat family protein n=1 Tax=Acanthopleuribacter pedis TaxID=442870 RepID=A0A8J7U6G1_9BACT|nr:tetratricopeptide repeat protein [Acanthopleuribacter pedis]MBO1321884.1 sel1 repeat family protein [Acanthopleuribacter pedis]
MRSFVIHLLFLNFINLGTHGCAPPPPPLPGSEFREIIVDPQWPDEILKKAGAMVIVEFGRKITGFYADHPVHGPIVVCGNFSQTQPLKVTFFPHTNRAVSHSATLLWRGSSHALVKPSAVPKGVNPATMPNRYPFVENQPVWLVQLIWDREVRGPVFHVLPMRQTRPFIETAGYAYLTEVKQIPTESELKARTFPGPTDLGGAFFDEGGRLVGLSNVRAHPDEVKEAMNNRELEYSPPLDMHLFMLRLEGMMFAEVGQPRFWDVFWNGSELGVNVALNAGDQPSSLALHLFDPKDMPSDNEFGASQVWPLLGEAVTKVDLKGKAELTLKTPHHSNEKIGIQLVFESPYHGRIPLKPDCWNPFMVDFDPEALDGLPADFDRPAELEAMLGVRTYLDRALALTLLKEQAEHDPISAFNLGVYYATGLQVARDQQRANHWFQIAAKGLLEAEGLREKVALGYLYRNGIVVPKDLDRARELFHGAARAGSGQAWFRLAQMAGTNAPERQLEFYRCAADTGYRPADIMLARLIPRLGINHRKTRIQHLIKAATPNVFSAESQMGGRLVSSLHRPPRFGMDPIRSELIYLPLENRFLLTVNDKTVSYYIDRRDSNMVDESGKWHYFEDLYDVFDLYFARAEAEMLAKPEQ